ncbi:MAG: DUF3052 domain-containing protein [Bacteroidetes bacterium]|nr:DUF3052 domain-containing protein [Bacteroidota bacterium]
MATAGYSGTPLLKKLGIQPAMKLLLIHAPDNYFALLAEGSGVSQKTIRAQVCTAQEVKDPAAIQFIHLFVTSNKVFEATMKQITPLYKKNSTVIIWVSWYKKAAKIPTDITEDMIRAYALSHGLVDVKVCAVSDVWSGLKLVVPLAKR